jgi:hypothetical protein
LSYYPSFWRYVYETARLVGIDGAVGAAGKGLMKRLTPLKAIRAKCVDCSGGNTYEPEKCESKDECPLWPYRLGNGGRIVSNKMRASLYKVRAKRKPKPVSKAIPVKIEAQTP